MVIITQRVGPRGPEFIAVEYDENTVRMESEDPRIRHPFKRVIGSFGTRRIAEEASARCIATVPILIHYHNF